MMKPMTDERRQAHQEQAGHFQPLRRTEADPEHGPGQVNGAEGGQGHEIGSERPGDEVGTGRQWRGPQLAGPAFGPFGGDARSGGDDGVQRADRPPSRS